MEYGKSCSDDVRRCLFIGALVVSFSPQRRAAEWGFLSAALTTLCMLSLISAFIRPYKSCRHVDVGQRGTWHCLAWSLIA